jgi:hypothetical protein
MHTGSKLERTPTQTTTSPRGRAVSLMKIISLHRGSSLTREADTREADEHSFAGRDVGARSHTPPAAGGELRLFLPHGDAARERTRCAGARHRRRAVGILLCPAAHHAGAGVRTPPQRFPRDACVLHDGVRWCTRTCTWSPPPPPPPPARTHWCSGGRREPEPCFPPDCVLIMQTG